MYPVLFNLALEKVMREISACHEMELNGKNVILAYDDDIVKLGDEEDDAVKAAEELIESSHRVNLTINEEKIKFFIMTLSLVNKTALKVGPYSFEQVNEFKYLGVNINTTNNMHNEIRLRINSANKAYIAMNKILSFRLLSKGTKEKLYTSFLHPIVMYACETWSTTQGNEEKLLTFERYTLRKIHGPTRLQNGEYERRKNEDLEMLFSKKVLQKTSQRKIPPKK